MEAVGRVKIFVPGEVIFNLFVYREGLQTLTLYFYRQAEKSPVLGGYFLLAVDGRQSTDRAAKQQNGGE
jgi:hypothetical protein